MSLPVFDWSTEVNGVRFFPDLGDGDAYYYGIHFTWGELIKKPLGEKRIIFHGELKLGPDSGLLKSAREKLGAVSLTPLAPSDYANEIGLRHEYDPGHVVQIRNIQTQPFETIVLSASVDLSAPDGKETATVLEERWQNHDVFDGMVRASYEFVIIDIAKSVKIEVREFRDQVFEIIEKPTVDHRTALNALNQAVGTSDFVEVVQIGVEGNPKADELAKLYIIRHLGDVIFRDNVTLLSFNDGRVLTGVQIRDALELDQKMEFDLKRYTHEGRKLVLTL